MSFAKFVFCLVNRIEAKLARLRCTSVFIEGLEVFYLTNTKHFNSNKPVLVLLHGFSADKYVWNRFARRFFREYQLLIPDLKGHGQTLYDPSQDYSIPSQCQLLLSLLDQLQISRFSVVGNSMGGMMAAKLIDDLPERVEKCVLIDPAGAKSEFVVKAVEKRANPFEYKDEQDFFDFYDLIMAKPPYLPKFMLRSLAREYMRKSQQHAHMLEHFYNLRDFYPVDYRFDFPNTMLIWGLNDKLLPIEDYLHWKTMLNGNTRVYEDLGHMPMLEGVKRVSKDVKCFLQGGADMTL